MSCWFCICAINDPKAVCLSQPPHDAVAQTRAIGGVRRLRFRLDAGA